MRKLYFGIMVTMAGICSATLGFAQPGVITTIAGNGVVGSGGDGGAATAAGLSTPMGVVMDKAGNLYICDRGNFMIRKVDVHGTITMFAGNGVMGAFSGNGTPATASSFAPNAVCMDTLGNFYFSDDNAICVYKIDTALNVTQIAGTGLPGNTGDGGPATAAKFGKPSGIAADNLGNIYVNDYEYNRVRIINAGGTINAYAGNGTSGSVGDGGSATAAELASPSGIAIDKNGNLYIADYLNNRIRKVTPSGIISTFAGNGTGSFSGDGTAANTAELYMPNGVATDTFGNVFISDYGNIRIRKVNTATIISTICGNGMAGYSGDGGPSTAAKLSNPNGVYASVSGAVFFSDDGNYRVRKIFNNHLPTFAHGAVQTISVCENSAGISIDSILAVVDSDQYQK